MRFIKLFKLKSKYLSLKLKAKLLLFTKVVLVMFKKIETLIKIFEHTYKNS